eukprot:369384-Rhodomonas_salina.3
MSGLGTDFKATDASTQALKHVRMPSTGELHRWISAHVWSVKLSAGTRGEKTHQGARVHMVRHSRPTVTVVSQIKDAVNQQVIKLESPGLEIAAADR